MRVAVYDRYWSTLGGGEQVAGAIAATLAERHDVELLGMEEIDHPKLAERLRLDLSALPMRVVDGDENVSAASLDYDVFVNCTYLSPTVNRAKHGLYYVHFPGPPGGGGRKDEVRRRVGSLVQGRTVVVVRANFLRSNVPGGPRRTNGLGVLDVYAPEGTRVDLLIGTPLTSPHRHVRVSVLSGRTVLGEDVVGTPGTTFSFTSSGESPQQLTLFTPMVDDGHGGVRHADIELRAMRIDGRPVPVPDDRLLYRLLPPDRLSYLRSYDRIASNSTFTAGWVQRLWGRSSDILYPPVNPVAPAARKDPIILSLGRFFDPAYGHCKKQLELVSAMRSLSAPGWELHLVGGVSTQDRNYAMQVRAAAEGLPVHVHMNATGALVADLLSRASIYWHAGGLGEDPELHPDRFEHFGIAVVEALSAGAVPVVFGAAGPAEIVEPEVSGLHFSSVDGLVAATERLVGDPSLLERLAAGARARAEHFGPAAFRKRLFELVS